jgi:hypothetical protein
VPEIPDRHRCPLGGKKLADRPANASAAADHKRRLASQPSHAASCCVVNHSMAYAGHRRIDWQKRKGI